MLSAFFSVIWLRLQQRWARNRTIRLLSELDDHMLRDIGVGRYEIPNKVEHCVRAMAAKPALQGELPTYPKCINRYNRALSSRMTY